MTQIFLSHFFWYHEICSVSEIKYHLVEHSAIKYEKNSSFCKNLLLFFKIFFGAVKVKTFWKFLLHNNLNPMPILFSRNKFFFHFSTFCMMTKSKKILWYCFSIFKALCSVEKKRLIHKVIYDETENLDMKLFNVDFCNLSSCEMLKNDKFIYFVKIKLASNPDYYSTKISKTCNFKTTMVL